jgi:hypothetical protein
MSWRRGFREMRQTVCTKYRLFFDCAGKLAPIVGDMVKAY